MDADDKHLLEWLANQKSKSRQAPATPFATNLMILKSSLPLWTNERIDTEVTKLCSEIENRKNGELDVSYQRMKLAVLLDEASCRRVQMI